MQPFKYAAVLTIAGSDSGGGAGIQADIKTMSALGCYATSAITAVTVQNTMGVTGIHAVPAHIVRGQIEAVMNDIQPMAIKIGMVHSKELALTLADTLQQYSDVPVVLDPVMISTSGHRLIEDDTIAVLKELLFPLATIITPNLDEAAVLCGCKISCLEEMKAAAATILQLGCRSVLVKGGHLQTPEIYDVFRQATGEELVLASSWIDSANVHGTGCTLSSAIASYMALGHTLPQAVQLAKTFITRAIEAGKDVVTGKGHGPLNHFFEPAKLIKHEME